MQRSSSTFLQNLIHQGRTLLSTTRWSQKFPFNRETDLVNPSGGIICFLLFIYFCLGGRRGGGNWKDTSVLVIMDKQVVISRPVSYFLILILHYRVEKNWSVSEVGSKTRHPLTRHIWYIRIWHLWDQTSRSVLDTASTPPSLSSEYLPLVSTSTRSKLKYCYLILRRHAGPQLCFLVPFLELLSFNALDSCTSTPVVWSVFNLNAWKGEHGATHLEPQLDLAAASWKAFSKPSRVVSLRGCIEWIVKDILAIFVTFYFILMKMSLYI